MSVEKAQSCLEQAEKKLSKFQLFGNKHEDAQELFQQAAIYFKANSRWEDAGNAYLRAQDCAQKLKSPMDCASYFQDAALMFKKVNLYKAAECMQKALDLWDQNGRSSKSAKLANELADLFAASGTDADIDNAIEWYDKAADYYKLEKSMATASQCKIKIAQYKAGQGKYPEAITIWEDTAAHYLDDPLLKSSSIKYYFMALLCRLAMGESVAQVREAFQKYEDKDLLFTPETREHVLITKLLAAMEALDVEAFNEGVEAYSSISPLDDLKTKLLKAAEGSISNPGLC